MTKKPRKTAMTPKPATPKLVVSAEVKATVGHLLANFTKEEMGNRVTNNNMMALTIQIGQALDGLITTTKPKAPAPTGEKNAE